MYNTPTDRNPDVSRRSKVPFRPLIHIPRGTVRLLFYLLLLSVIVFFGVTRTDVGREMLKAQLEREFDSQFGGTLRIGRLSGNLVYQFNASDVHILDHGGDVVVQVDSIVARPRWRRVMNGRIEFGRLHLYGLRVDLIKEEDGRWNLPRILATAPRTDSTGNGIESVAVGDLRIVDGRISTRSLSTAHRLVSDKLLFDFENSTVGIMSASAIVDWRPTDAQIDLIGLKARVEDRDVDVLQAQGQIVYNDDALLANQVTLRTTGTSLRFTGSVDKTGAAGDPRIDVDLAAEPLDASELSRLVPRMPIRSTASVTARVRGPVSELAIQELSVIRGQSRFGLEATAVGLPDSLRFEITLAQGQLTRRDVTPLLPNPARLNVTGVDSVNFSLLARGVVRDPLDRPAISGEFFLDAGSDAGRFSGRVALEKETEQPWRISTDFFAGDLSIDRIVPTMRRPTTLNGDVSLSLRGRSFRDMDLEAELSLGTSQILGRTVDSLKALAAADEGLLRAEVQAVRGDGEVNAQIEADLSETLQRYSVGMTTRRLDLGPVVLSDSLRSSLTSEINARFR
ncbi:MAG: hypothetical protein R3178_05670, partial [Rhodothermales bacterium]|nr:hypothetical protein [Rhodothermales bacterium]